MAPHGIPQGLLQAVEAAMCEAWAKIHVRGAGSAFDPSTANEDAITLVLQQTLWKMLQDAPSTALFSTRRISTVERSPSVPSWNGKKINKQPDLVFRLCSTRPYRARHEAYGIFAECKVIEPSKRINLYCKNGLARYVTGDYAWYMRTAMMFAFVRNCHTTPSNLAKYLYAREKEFSTISVGIETPCRDRPCPSKTLVTIHDRTGVDASQGRPAGEIQMSHLWFQVGKTRSLQKSQGQRKGS
jgi:hypothetical protein